MVRKALEVLILMIFTRFIICGGWPDVAALIVTLAAYFVNSYLDYIKSMRTNPNEKIEAELQILKDQVGQLSLAQGFKKL